MTYLFNIENFIIKNVMEQDIYNGGHRVVVVGGGGQK